MQIPSSSYFNGGPKKASPKEREPAHTEPNALPNVLKINSQRLKVSCGLIVQLLFKNASEIGV